MVLMMAKTNEDTFRVVCISVQFCIFIPILNNFSERATILLMLFSN
jgi:hypothetical protein